MLVHDTPQAEMLAAGLAGIAATLGRLARHADSGLLPVGERLGATAAILGELTSRFEALPRELEDPSLREAGDRLREAARKIAATAQALVGERAALTRLAGLNDQVGARIAQLGKTVRAIAILAVNAQIEAAHIDATREDFSAFANEIVRLARMAETTIEGYAQEHERLAGLLRSAGAMQARFAKTHEGTLRSIGQRLEDSLHTVDSRRIKAAGAAAEIGRRSKRISEEIGVLVMALQIGDITRQRLEHVGEALVMVSGGLKRADAEADDIVSWSSSLAEDEKTAVTASVCRMQSAQMEEAAVEFDAEIRRVIAALARLADEAAAIVRFGAETYGAAERHGSSFLEELETNLRTTGALVQDCETARAEVDGIVAAVTEALGDLLARLASVRRIETDMRLVGLNTTLKCGRLGSEGRTLSVVAQELRGYANQTIQDADALMAALQEIAAAAERFEQERRARGADGIAVMGQGLAASLAPFEECGTRLSQALSILTRQGSEIGRTLTEIAGAVTIHDEIASALKADRDRLDRLVATVDADGADAAIIGERLRFFATGRYTMASERDVHARFMPGFAAPSPAAEPALDEILF